MQNESDKELHNFFRAMKENDLEIPTPDFPAVAKGRTIKWWIPVGIAASLALGFFLWPESQDPAPAIGEIVIITLEEGPENELQFRIQETNEMDQWQAPTESLLTEF